MFRVVFEELARVVVKVGSFGYFVAKTPAVGCFAVTVDGGAEEIATSTPATVRRVVRRFVRIFAGKLGEFGESLLTIFFHVPVVGSQTRGGVEVFNPRKIYPFYPREVVANFSCDFYFFGG